jgi:dimethylglycine oxidase
MKNHARVVIIGGGIVGCSTAYHLSKLGWRDIVVLDMGPLFTNLGSSSHAPGLMFEHNNSKTVTTLAMWTVDTYLAVEKEARQGQSVWQVGSLEIAHTPERWEELKRKLGNSLAWGLEAHLVGPDEIKQMVPIMRTDDLYGAFYVPNDCNVRGVGVMEALAECAKRDGAAEFYEKTNVTGIEVRGGRVRAVETDQGRIETENVVCAAGLWGPVVGRMVGVDIPLTPCQHLFAKTKPLPELAGETEWLRHPFVRYQDQDMYFRQYADAYGFGSYRHEPLLVPAEKLPHDDHPAMFDFTPGHFEESMADAVHRFPCFGRAEIDMAFNGLFSFTADGNSILGEHPDVRGFWSAEAVWVTHAGGVGRMMAEWLVDGRPSIDAREVDINRLHPHSASPAYVERRAYRQYVEVYDIIHQLQQTADPRGLRTHAYHNRMEALGAVFFESVGWEKPQWYEANASLLGEYPGLPVRQGWAAQFWSPIIGAEHRAVRDRAGLFELNFFKIEVTGPGALAFLQSVTGNQMDRPVGSLTYTSMLDDQGGIKADLTVMRLGPERFWVITGNGLGWHDLAWLRTHAPDDGSVRLQNVSSAWEALGLWGPKARDILQAVSQDDFSNEAFPYTTARSVYVEHVAALAARISYAGELGWELYTPTEYGMKLWDTLWQAGLPHGLIAAGGGAFDSLRLEKGYRLWGADIHTEYNPYEAGLGFTVKLKKGDFIGREALAKVRAEARPGHLASQSHLGDGRAGGVKRKLVCLAFDDPAMAIMGKEPIFAPGGDRALGYVTSANYGYSVGKSLAYGYLPVELASEGTPVEIYYYGERYLARVDKDPQFDPLGERMKV